MAIDLLSGLTDEEKLNFFDSKILELTDELYKIETEPVYGRRNDVWYANQTSQLKRNVERFKLQRESVLDRLKLGISNNLEKIKNHTDSKQVFIAVWFDDSMNESINAIETGVKNAGLIPMCIRDEHFSDRIMDKALAEIKKSRLVIIDLTGNRSSVFFEAGFAFGLGVEPIYVYKKEADKSNSLEFYVKHYKCYPYESGDDLTKKLEEIIKARIGFK